jgi:thymidylate synthase (FAD)
MKIVKPSFSILNDINGDRILKSIEAAGRTCYKSETTITADSAIKFVKNILSRNHESVLEHQFISVRIICDRGVSHEIVRHRIASYSQESTRYCNYCKEKFEGHITLIHPQGLTEQQRLRREEHFWSVQRLYDLEISEGLSPQIARGILPTALKTEIVVTMNLREWRHFFKLRAVGMAGKPHPQMIEITIPMLNTFKELIPVVFDDLLVSTEKE